MILPVVLWPDLRLSMTCAPVEPGEDLSALAADMLETMYAAPGRGLAAPQVGVLKRLFVMDVTWKEGTPAPRICLNPVLEPAGPPVTGPEACLSIPGIATDITRDESIVLHWTALDGTRHSETLTGFASICAQHETDHLDGILTLDRLSPDARETALQALG